MTRKSKNFYYLADHYVWASSIGEILASQENGKTYVWTSSDNHPTQFEYGTGLHLLLNNYRSGSDHSFDNL